MIYTAIILGLLALGTSIISGVVGMAGGITLLSLMTFLMPMSDIVAVHGAVQLVSNASRCYFLRHKIVKDVTVFFFLGAPLGVLGAYSLLSMVVSRSWFYWPILILIGYTLFKPKKMPGIIIPKRGFFFLGVVTGFLGPLIGATGPLMAPFFLRDDLDREEIVATKAVTQMFTHLLKIPLFLSLHFPYQSYTLVIILMVIGAIVGTRLGVHLLGKTSEVIFRRIYKFALFFAALRLIWKLSALSI